MSVKVTFTEEQVEFIIHCLAVSQKQFFADHDTAHKNSLPRIACQFMRQADEASALIAYLESH